MNLTGQPPKPDLSRLKPPVYLSGSITGGREDTDIYQRIEAALSAAGWPVIGGDVVTAEVTADGCSMESEDVWERDLERLESVARRGGFLVAEVSRPSLGVGYEIATARWKFHLQVVALWRPKWTSRCSAMVSGDPDVMLIQYDEENLDDAVESLLIALEGMCDDGNQVVPG